MPKLPALMSQQVIKILERHGFILDHSSGSHRLYYDPGHETSGDGSLSPTRFAERHPSFVLKQAGIDREALR